MKKWAGLLLKEISFVVIAFLLVVLAMQLIGHFSGIWIGDIKELVWLSAIFYGIIGFYRILNFLARKSKGDRNHANQ